MPLCYVGLIKELQKGLVTKRLSRSMFSTEVEMSQLSADFYELRLVICICLYLQNNNRYYFAYNINPFTAVLVKGLHVAILVLSLIHISEPTRPY